MTLLALPRPWAYPAHLLRSCAPLSFHERGTSLSSALGNRVGYSAFSVTNNSLPSRSSSAMWEVLFTTVRTVALHLSLGISPVMV